MSACSHLVFPSAPGHYTMHANQFPAFQFTDADVQRGAVKVTARSPSGQQQQLSVQTDACGQYTTDFTPNEAGDWTIKVLYDGRNIDGSPFSVRVYDPSRVRVYGLQDGCNTGKPVTFFVDPTGAGKGELAVDVSYNGQILAASIERNGNAFAVSFMPIGPGSYNIQVFFAQMEVAGSPFTVHVANPACVVCSGDALTSAKIGNKTAFFINTGQDCAGCEPSVRISPPSGALLPVNLVALGSGVYRAEFTPNQVGNHTIDVKYCDTMVPESPFNCRVYDASRILVTNIPSHTVICKQVDFYIDASDAGNGELEILINDGNVPVKVETTGVRQYHGSFMPCEAITHVIKMIFNDHEVMGSPWLVEVRSADGVHTTACDLSLLQVHHLASFEVHTVTDGNVQIFIQNIAPSRSCASCPVQTSVVKQCPGIYKVEFTPSEVGTYQISGMFEELAIPGLPCKFNVFDPQAICVSPVDSVAAGELVEFTVDASAAGVGELTIVVNEGDVPSSARMIGQKCYAVSFLPTVAGYYTVELFFNDQPVKDSPLLIGVVDPCKVILSGSKLVPVGELVVIKADASTAGKANLTAKVTAPSGREVQSTVKSVSVGGFDIEFTPKEVGPHKVVAEFGCQRICADPFVVVSYDISRIRVMGVGDGMAACHPSSFIVDLNKCGEGELNVSILSAMGHPVLNEVTELEPGRLEVKYQPTEAGIHFAEITFNDEHIKGSPFQFKVHDPSRVKTRGEGLDLIQCSLPATFFITAPDAELKDIDVLITGPDGRHVIPNVTETRPFNFKVEYNPRASGVYQVDIHYFGCGIAGAPFPVRAWDASRVLIANVKQGECGVESFFNVELGDAGDGTIEITISGPSGQLIPNQVVTASPGLLAVHYTPTATGMYTASVTYNGVPVPGSPAQFKVVDPHRVMVRGDGLGLVQCGCVAAFLITAPDARLCDLDVAITSPVGKELVPIITESTGGNFRVEYTPTIVGTYPIRVAVFDKELACSPFVAKAWDASRVLLADVSMAEVGIESAFKVVVTEAGEGVLEITLTDPMGHLLANQVVSAEPGVLDVIFKPKVAGLHRGTVAFNCEKVPASPFTFVAIDVASVSCFGDGLCHIPVKKLTYFTITAPQTQLKDITTRIAGPNGREVMSRITETTAGNFKVDYTPQIAGEHFVTVGYHGRTIPSCPISVQVWDISKVFVSPINMAFCGIQSQFTVDAREAGDGKLEVTISGPQNQRVVSNVTTDNRGAFVVSYIPTCSGIHRADVTFNCTPVSGNPFSFMVADPENVSVTGEGVDLVRCNKATSFTISAPAGRLSDMNVRITGPNRKAVHNRIQEAGAGTFLVEYTPTIAGDYSIAVKYFDETVKGSPFTAHAWDPAGVVVSNIRPGIVARPSNFEINATRAGSGSLEISVTCRGENIPNSARALGASGDIEVMFTPKYIDSHYVNIRFNNESVPGSPYIVPILDGGLATASGPGLGHVICNKPTTFNVATGPVGGDADLVVIIASPTNQRVLPSIEGTPARGFLVNYTPVEAGTHSVQIQYADVPIKGSPFSVDVFNPAAVTIIGQVPSFGLVGKAVSFKVNSSSAGHGHVIAQVKGNTSQPAVTGSGTVQGIYSFSFVPLETAEHTIFVYFNDVNIPGSPFPCYVVDQKNLHVNWDSLRLRPVNQLVDVDLVTDGAVVDADITCIITDPYGNQLMTDHTAKPRNHRFTFVAKDPGPHVIDLRYGTEPIVGSPFTCNVYDSRRVRIVDATPCANVGEDVSFTVDTTEAGMGDIEVNVTQGTGMVPTRRHQLCPELARFSFVARSPKDHCIHVTFNAENIPVSPLTLQVVNPASKMSLSNGNAARFVPVGQTVWGVVSPPGYTIFPEDVLARATAPSGDMIPTTIVQQTDGSIKIEYNSTFTGPHSLDVEYCGQLIPGSPLVTEIFDPSKILLEGSRAGRVGQLMILDVSRVNAGDAELTITLNDPNGVAVAFDVELAPYGERVSYVPQVAGAYKVIATYGGLNVPGCPLQQDITAATVATASGSGLDRGIVDRVAEFFVNIKGERGELVADVQGPNSVARCTIEPDTGGRLKVKYVPTEVGIFTLLLEWNGVEVEGCPFHPRVVDPLQVLVVDQEDLWTAPGHLKVQAGEMHSMVFDCQHAGPGTLRVTVEGPDGEVENDLMPVNTDVNLNNDVFVLKFMPRKEADYTIRAYWCDMPIELFPIVATAMADIRPPCPHIPQPPQIRADLVGVQGQGISLAYVCDQADFVIDGTEAGPGEPEVKLIGVKTDIEVMYLPIAPDVYACTYVPELAGAYLLSVLWSGKHVPGSPFKVSVMSCSDATKVSVSGEALKNAICCRDNAVLIDARRAGCGEVVAECTGPSKQAFCCLVDRFDGMFELLIKPQEPGMHTLQIKYGGESVPGSPFNIKVTAAPDASKVQVTGDGINNGLLATFQSTFQVDTRGAGPGQLTVKVRGPKGAFRVEMTRQPGNDRCILCRYYPTEVGVYQVYVLWSGEHAIGSPFQVHIVDTIEQLRHLMLSQQEELGLPIDVTNGYDTARLSNYDSNRVLLFSDDF